MRKATVLSLLLCLQVVLFAQSGDEEAIKKVLRTETETYFNRDIEAWKQFFHHGPETRRTFVSRYGYHAEVSWDTVWSHVQAQFKQAPDKQEMSVETSNFNIVQKGDMAWVEYDQVRTGPSVNALYKEGHSHESRTMVKEGSEWKIIAQITTSPESYETGNPQMLENDLNTAGYNLITAKKLAEAIEVFKLNVKLFPEAWNTYDSLGEAYALAGDKKKAIENYEKSVKLNPKSESGPPALQKLKQK